MKLKKEANKQKRKATLEAARESMNSKEAIEMAKQQQRDRVISKIEKVVKAEEISAIPKAMRKQLYIDKLAENAATFSPTGVRSS